MLELEDKFCMFCKIYFDGYDFMRTQFGQILIPPEIQPVIQHITYMDKLYDNADTFIEYCQGEGNYILPSLMSKYHVGSYQLSQCNHKDNPWKNNDYILFNTTQVHIMFERDVPDLDFWVCPAYDENGQIEDIGFRLKDTSLVHNAFKWLFPKGNNIIYGKNTVNKDETCYIVEGFRDYVALNESGYNCIGLGSVFLSDKQKEYIKTLKDPILLLDGDRFGLQQTITYADEYKTALLVQTQEKDAYDTFVKGIPIKIVNITK